MINVSKSLRSFKFAFQGLIHLFREENNARVHLLATALAVGLGFYLNIVGTEWLWLLSAITLVWMTEAINTALENLVDMVSPQQNPKAGVIKDLGAAAVLIASGYAVIVGVVLFGSRLFLKV